MGYKRKKRLVSFETVDEELSPKKQRKERNRIDDSEMEVSTGNNLNPGESNHKKSNKKSRKDKIELNYEEIESVNETGPTNFKKVRNDDESKTTLKKKSKKEKRQVNEKTTENESRPENSDETEHDNKSKKKLKKKCTIEKGQKNKKVEEEKEESIGAETEENEEPDVSKEEDASASKEKKKPSKRQLKKETKESREREKLEIAKHETALKVLNYVSKWKYARSEWKFEKVKQTWLVKHILDETLVPDKVYSTVLEYFEGSKGMVKENLVKQAMAIVKEVEEKSEESEELLESTKYQRARQLLQALPTET